MNNQIQELELQLKEAKQQELKLLWEAYLDQLKDFCKKLVGRVILTESTSRAFNMQKVTGYNEQWYATVSGIWGQLGPERWIELETEGVIRFCIMSADYKGNQMRATLDHLDQTSAAHRFVFKKGSRIDIAKLDFTSLNLDGCAPFAPKTIKLGHTEYEEYRSKPEFDRALSAFMMNTRVMEDNSVYDQAVRLYLKQTEDLKNFWLANSDRFDNLVRVDSLLPKKDELES